MALAHRKRLAVAALAASIVGTTQTARAQELEVVVVTAQKREQSLQDVGISVAVLGASQLEQLGASNTTDIAQQVPALRLSAWSPAFTIFSLRGVSQNNFQDNLEAPVAVYLDGVYAASMNAVNAQLFDMERVEVLRGPQGTLFGRNATGGLIHFISKKPTEAKANGYVELGAADFNTYSAEGAFGGSFSERVRGRIAGRYEKSDGYVKAGTAFDTQATGRTSQGANGAAVRGMLQIDATDNVLIDLTAAYSKDDDVPTGQYVVTLAGFDRNTGLGAFDNAYSQNPDAEDPIGDAIGPENFSRTPITGKANRHWSNQDTYLDRETKSLTAQVSARLGEMNLVSITNGMDLDKFYLEDAAGGLGYFPYNTVVDYRQWSQELRLSGGEQQFRWQLGAYYLDMKWDTFQSVAGALYLGGTSDTQKLSTMGLIDSTNASLFAQAEYDLTEEFTMIAGLRWSRDEKDLALRRVYEDVPNGVAPTEVFNLAAAGIPGIDTIDYDDYAARLQLNFVPNDDNLLYAAFNRGIKGGNWSLDPSGAVALTHLKHGPEVLNAYEVGWKSDLWDGRARLNVAAFYYDYQDYQAFSLVNLVPQVTNSDADANGGEIELTLAPATGLTLQLGAAFLDSTVDAVPDVFGGTVKAEFPLAPHTSLNALARYEWPAFGGTLAVQIDGLWNDDQYLEGTNSQVSFEPAYSVWNSRVSFSSAGDKVQLNLYVRNLTDEEYRVYNLDLGLLGFIEQAYGPPRQFGASVAYKW
jgi:iron complex outermembrane receptor protein